MCSSDLVLILTHDPEGTRDWFVNNLGFRNGYHPEFGFPVYWLYIGEQDVIHIGKARHSEHQDTYLKTPTDADLLLSDGCGHGNARREPVWRHTSGVARGSWVVEVQKGCGPKPTPQTLGHGRSQTAVITR